MEKTAVDSKEMDVFQAQKTSAHSPWMQSDLEDFKALPAPLWTAHAEGFTFDLVESGQSVWCIVRFPKAGTLTLRLAYCPGSRVEIETIEARKTAVDFRVLTSIGEYQVGLQVLEGKPFIHFKTDFIPSAGLTMPFWPRDMMVMGTPEDPAHTQGIIHASQAGPRSGLMFFSLTQPQAGSALYFQNLTSLNDYCQQTETSLSGVVGGQWPELGLALPESLDKPLQEGKKITLSDAFVLLTAQVPPDTLVMARMFIDMLAQVYLQLPVSSPEYIHWPDIAERALRDLSSSPKCWTEIEGKRYANAYIADYKNPPESMVQLTLLLPILEYQEWSGKEIPLAAEMLELLPGFFDPKAGVFGRWLLSTIDWLDGSEPQKKPRSMDSWYLYHSLINISRLAKLGYETPRKLFLDSLEYAMKVARHFNYRWPVFYNMDTLEGIVEETKPGEGGELDVAGLYAHVMMQAWDMTKDKTYLEEAKRAAQSLKGLGLNLFYQANTTLFSTGAMLRLYKETGDELYRNLSFLCLGNVFNQLHLWECNYGYGRDYLTFLAMYPLKEAPYTAAYEEMEGLAACHDYLSYSGDRLPESVEIFLGEFVSKMLHRAVYYYPAYLPKEMIADKPRTGEIDPELWIPLEDIYDGREKAGQVGQEVYGAGMPFTFLTRHYFHVLDSRFLLYVNYPIQAPTETPGTQVVHFKVSGSPRLNGQMRLIPNAGQHLTGMKVTAELNGQKKTLEPRFTQEGHLEYEILGNQKITIRQSLRKEIKKT